MDSDEYLVNRPDLGDRSEVQAGEFYPVVGVGPHPYLGQLVNNTILNI